jgi:hypothetical protein
MVIYKVFVHVNSCSRIVHELDFAGKKGCLIVVLSGIHLDLTMWLTLCCFHPEQKWTCSGLEILHTHQLYWQELSLYVWWQVYNFGNKITFKSIVILKFISNCLSTWNCNLNNRSIRTKKCGIQKLPALLFFRHWLVFDLVFASPLFVIVTSLGLKRHQSFITCKQFDNFTNVTRVALCSYVSRCGTNQAQNYF